MTKKLVTDPCQSCGLSTSPGSGRFVNRIPASGDVELPDGSTEYQHGWGCALCYEHSGWADPDGTWCELCAEERDPQQERMEALYADDIKTYVRCDGCNWVIFDWDGIERGTA